MPTATVSISSHFTSSAGSLLGNAGVADCYNPFLVEAEGPALGLHEMAATMHYLAMVWSPTISLTWLSDGYFTF